MLYNGWIGFYHRLRYWEYRLTMDFICDSCGNLTNETVRLVLNKIPYRVCMDCIKSAIHQEKQILDMRDFMNHITERGKR